MALRIARSQLLYRLALVITLALSLLPASWLGWVKPLSTVVSLPVMPLVHVGSWLRPEPDGPAGARTERERELVEEAARWERLYHESELRIQELAEQIEELQRFPIESLPRSVQPLPAEIVGRDPTSRVGLVELNRGARHGVVLETIAVFGPDHIFGRVRDVSSIRSFVLPVTNPASGLLRAAVIPRDQPSSSILDAVPVQLEPVGNGTFRAEVSQEHDLGVGDVVKLTDRRWPQPAQARVIGYVESVEAKPEAPLRDVVIVRPRFQAEDLRSVTLLIETDDARSDGGEP